MRGGLGLAAGDVLAAVICFALHHDKDINQWNQHLLLHMGLSI